MMKLKDFFCLTIGNIEETVPHGHISGDSSVTSKVKKIKFVLKISVTESKKCIFINRMHLI